MMDDADKRHIEELLLIRRRRLRELEKDEATFGSYVPPQVRMEIQDIRVQITHLETQLQQYSLQQRYRVISVLRHKGQWQAVLDEMYQLHSLQPDYPDTERLFEWAQRQQRLEQLYNDALIADARGELPAAIAALEKLLRENPDNTHAKALLNQVRAKQFYTTALAVPSYLIRYWRLTIPAIVLLLISFIWARNVASSTKLSAVSASPPREQPQATVVQSVVFPTTVSAVTPLQDECSLAGGEIAFQARRGGITEIHTVRPDGTKERNLTPNAVRELVPVWSVDDTKIAFQSSRSGNLEIFSIDANGSNPQNLTNHPADDNTPAWSPNGQQIAFMSNRDGRGNTYNFNIYIMNADGSNVQRFTSGSGLDKSPAWSPDGRRIAFVSNRDGQFDIYIANLDGTGEVQVTNTPDKDENFPAWSPDGQHIVFSSKRGNNPTKIFQINADGTNLRQFTTDAADDDHPTWSPDGNCIAFESTLNGSSQIYVMPVAGAQAKRSVSSGSTEDHNPSWSHTR